MASTTINFTPSETASPPFTGQFQTDAGNYVFETRWNLAGQRWFLFLYDPSGSLTKTTPLVSSNQTIDLLFGLIPGTALYYSEPNSTFTVTTQD